MDDINIIKPRAIAPKEIKDGEVKYKQAIEMVNVNDMERIAFIEVCNYFDIDPDEWVDSGKMKQLEHISKWVLSQDETNSAIRRLETLIGNIQNNDEKIYKIYQYIKLGMEIDNKTSELKDLISLQNGTR